MRAVRITLVGMIVAFSMAGCATDRLEQAPPSGVNLTGEWKLNLNLSDDPDKLGPDTDDTQQPAPPSHRGRGGRGGGMGMPPMGGPGASTSPMGTPGMSSDGPGATMSLASTGAGGGYGYVPAPPGIEQPTPLPSGNAQSSTTTTSRGANINRYLRAPARISITQKDAIVTMLISMPDGTQGEEAYTAGTTTIPYGKDNTAERTVGWRGPVFVVSTTVKKGGWREDDFAIDDDGRLIMTTQTKGGRLGKVTITRVYDRVRGARS
jgi:hypothetical protein